MAGGVGDLEAGPEARPHAAASARIGVEIARALGGVGGGQDYGANKGTLLGPDIVRQAISAKWAKGSSGPAGDEHHNLVVADPISANEGRTYTHEGKGNFRLHNVIQDEPILFRKAQKAHDADDCERWEAADEPGTITGHGTTTSEALVQAGAVRRLTPLECERLQGFPDGWTCLCQPIETYDVDPDTTALECRCADSGRYRALGNAVTVSVAAWIGQRMLAAIGSRP